MLRALVIFQLVLFSVYITYTSLFLKWRRHDLLYFQVCFTIFWHLVLFNDKTCLRPFFIYKLAHWLRLYEGFFKHFFADATEGHISIVEIATLDFRKFLDGLLQGQFWGTLARISDLICWRVVLGAHDICQVFLIYLHHLILLFLFSLFLNVIFYGLFFKFSEISAFFILLAFLLICLSLWLCWAMPTIEITLFFLLKFVFFTDLVPYFLQNEGIFFIFVLHVYESVQNADGIWLQIKLIHRLRRSLILHFWHLSAPKIIRFLVEQGADISIFQILIYLIKIFLILKSRMWDDGVIVEKTLPIFWFFGLGVVIFCIQLWQFLHTAFIWVLKDHFDVEIISKVIGMPSDWLLKWLVEVVVLVECADLHSASDVWKVKDAVILTLI